MIEFSISDTLKSLCPDLHYGIITADISNTEFSSALWEEINTEIANKQGMSFGEIKQIPIIDATRKAYKLTGKDPNRYRPAGEGLLRRIVKQNDLYKINTAVDLVNLWAIKFGYSVGGFDAEMVKGAVVAGIGMEDEIYRGIGRGKINVAGMPIIRDQKGGIGTPTSDEERTALQLKTNKMLVVFNGYAGKNDMEPVLEYASKSMETFLSAEKIAVVIKG